MSSAARDRPELTSSAIGAQRGNLFALSDDGFLKQNSGLLEGLRIVDSLQLHHALRYQAQPNSDVRHRLAALSALPCVQNDPLLYLSLYFKQHRAEYYDLLDRIRREGDWEAWLAFFLDGVQTVAEGAVTTARRLAALFEDDRRKVARTGRRAASALRVHEALKARPILSLPALRDTTGLSFPAVSSAMDLLVDLGIARELTGKRRNRLFAYDRYLATLSEGAERQ